MFVRSQPVFLESLWSMGVGAPGLGDILGRMERLYAVGDVHGDAVRLSELLRGAGLVDAKGSWAGGGATLILTGDLTNRGRSGIETIALVRELETQAAGSGGWVAELGLTQ